MKLTGTISNIDVGFLDGITKLTLAINEKDDLKTGYDELKGYNKLAIEVKPYREKRSLSANAYFWVLCGKLADKIGSTKTEVYQHYIKQTNIYRQAVVSEEAAPTIEKMWGAYGIGWVCEKVDTNNGFVTLNLYFGSSTYNTKQMSRLLDSVIEDCKEQGIQTMTPDEIANLKSLWERERI